MEFRPFHWCSVSSAQEVPDLCVIINHCGYIGQPWPTVQQLLIFHFPQCTRRNRGHSAYWDHQTVAVVTDHWKVWIMMEGLNFWTFEAQRFIIYWTPFVLIRHIAKDPLSFDMKSLGCHLVLWWNWRKKPHRLTYEQPSRNHSEHLKARHRWNRWIG